MTNPSHETDVSMFSVGTILGHTFSTFSAHPFVFIGLAVLAQVPWLIILAMGGNFLIASVVDVILIWAFQGVAVFGVYEVLRGNTAQFGEALSRGMARIVPAILVVLLLSVTVGLVGGLSYLLVVFISLILMILGIGGPVVSIIGLLFMFFITMWMFCKWAVAIPISAVEGLGPIKSLKRSSELTKGCRWKIFALFILHSVICAPVYIFTALGLGFMTGSPVTDLPIAYIHQYFHLNLFIQLTAAIWISLYYVMIAVIYYGLREIKEGFSVDDDPGTGNRDPLPR